MSNGHPSGSAERPRDDSEIERSTAERRHEPQLFDTIDQLYQNVYQAAPLAFVMWDTQCRICDWNSRAETVFGWSREEALGRNFFELLLPGHARPDVEKIATSVLWERGRSRAISECLTKSGEIILCEWHNAIRYDGKGQVSGAISFGLDITERQRAEAALKAKAELERRVEERKAELRNSEHRYRALIEEASDAIVICDTDGYVQDVNRRAVRLFGYSKEELKRRRFTELHPEPDSNRHAVVFEEVLREGSGSLSDGVIVRKDGELVPVDITASVIWTGDGALVQGLFRDITERRRAEEVVRNIAEGVAAATGEAFFQSLVRQLARMMDMDIAFIGEFTDERRETVTTLAIWLQDRIAENFQYELANTPCENVVGKVLCCYPEGVQQRFPKDEMLQVMNVACYVGVPLFDSRNRPLGLIATLDSQPLANPKFVESTLRVFAARASAELERKRFEEALVKSEKDLRFLSAQLLSAQESERARIARELHDGVGQSLGALKVRVERLLQIAKADDCRIDLQELSSLVPVIQEAMEEVRNTSMGLRPSTLDTLGILATITWFCREFQKTYPSLRVHRKTDIEEGDVPPPLKTVVYRILQQAFNNVAKHSGADTVRLLLAGEDGRITLSVEDNGKGFDVSSQSNSPTGLGLGSMKERTDLSGGRFDIESEPGKGTRVRASWPVGRT